MIKNTLWNILSKIFCYIQFDLQPKNGSFLDRLSVRIIKIQSWLKG